MHFDQIKLKNGLRIIGLPIEQSRSVAIGLWIGTGSQYEQTGEGGLSHFIEHMVFKGTQKYSARRIAEEMDAVGGHLNAFTAKECTCFYTRVVEDRAELALDVLSQMVIHPLFDTSELEKERGVVLEEIAMCEDTPEDLGYELLMEAHFGDQPIARPILGTEDGIGSYSADALRTYWRKTYKPQTSVLALAGKYDLDRIIALAEAFCGSWQAEEAGSRSIHTRQHAPGVAWREKDIEQVHINLGYPGLSYADEGIYALSVLSSVLGGSMSSRLFQRIREDTGAAYSVYSSVNDYTDCGMLSVYAATTPQNVEKVISMLHEEASRLARDGVSEREFTMAVEQMRASYILSLESASARMQAAGRRLLLLNETLTDDQILERIGRIRIEEVNALARTSLGTPCSVSVVGEDAEKWALRAKG